MPSDEQVALHIFFVVIGLAITTMIAIGAAIVKRFSLGRKRDAPMSSEGAAADPRNAPGDFYVEKDCCTLCGVPSQLAPELFADDDDGCWVARQPATPIEQQKMLKVIEMQELGCVRYRGNDRRIVRLINDRV